MKNYENNFLRKLLWWFAGADVELISKIPPSEQHKHNTIGIISITNLFVHFFVGFWASIYIFYSYIPAIIFGIVWALIISNIDKAINSTFVYDKVSSIQIIPRVLIIILIGVITSEIIQVVIFNDYLQNEPLIEQLIDLEKLKQQTMSINIIGIVITLLITLIQLLPLFIKLISPTKLYNTLVRQKEELYLYNELKTNEVKSETLLKIAQLKEEAIRSGDLDKNKIFQIIAEMKEDENKELKNKSTSFDGYFQNIANNLTEQANISNRKAQNLLWQGIIIIFIGIAVYVGLVIYWVSIFQEKGFQTYHFYVLFATSIMFLFFEFLGAWFLKQYQNSINTSFYILKFKAVLDRYYLSYLAIQNFEVIDDSSKASLKDLLNLLSAELKFPDTTTFKNNISFTKEAFESINSLTNTIKTLSEKK